MIVSVRYESNNSRLSVYEKVDWMVCQPDLKHLPQRILLRLGDKKSVTVSAVIPVHTSVKQEEIKTVSLLTKLSCSLVT